MHICYTDDVKKLKGKIENAKKCKERETRDLQRPVQLGSGQRSKGGAASVLDGGTCDVAL